MSRTSRAGTHRVRDCCHRFAPRRPSLEPVAALVSRHTWHLWGLVGGSPRWLAVPRRILGGSLRNCCKGWRVSTPVLRLPFWGGAPGAPPPRLWPCCSEQGGCPAPDGEQEPPPGSSLASCPGSLGAEVSAVSPGEGQLLKGSSVPSPSRRSPSPCPESNLHWGLREHSGWGSARTGHGAGPGCRWGAPAPLTSGVGRPLAPDPTSSPASSGGVG